MRFTLEIIRPNKPNVYRYFSHASKMIERIDEYNVVKINAGYRLYIDNILLAEYVALF